MDIVGKMQTMDNIKNRVWFQENLKQLQLSFQGKRLSTTKYWKLNGKVPVQYKLNILMAAGVN